MTVSARLKQPYIWPLLLLIAANGLILAQAPPALRYGAALVLLAFLPGWVWLQAFFNRPAEPIERLVLAAGLSLALTIIEAMFVVYLPGPLSMPNLLIATNGLIILGLGAIGWQQHRPGGPSTAFAERARPLRPDDASPARFSLQGRTWLILGLILILAAALRLPRLGYAEFHEDEAETLMLGVRLLQGEDYALFLHRKGPAQMLVPVTLWLLTGRLDETLARLPFALSSILSVAALFFLGWRWFNWPAAAAAGLLWAINGFAIAFGRMVQYQALIFFLGPLAIYCLYLAWKYHYLRLQIPAALLLAACLLAHYDALLLLPAAAYLSWTTLRGGAERPHGAAADPIPPLSLRRPAPPPSVRIIVAALALALFSALVTAFYLPYLRDPEFANTAAYLSGTRIKPGLLYNNLTHLHRINKLYSSHFYLPLLVVGAIVFVARQSLDSQAKWRWGLAGLGLLAVSTVWRPAAWQIGSVTLALLPWLALILVGLRLSAKTEIRAAWVLFGAGFIGYIFLVDDPRSHVYIMYPGLLLLAGAGWSGLMARSAPGSAAGKRRSPQTRRFLPARPGLLIPVAGLLLVGATLIYTGAIFLQTESGLDRARRWWSGSLWETLYDELPKARTYFGYPKREGWKAIGALRAQGLFPRDFRSMNENFIVPIWYNYGRARSCYTTPAHFFVRAGLDERLVNDEQYGEVGRVQREGEIRLRIFSAGANSQAAPTLYRLEPLAAAFDRLATPGQFARQRQPSRLMETQFGPAIKFVGYDLPAKTVAPGQVLRLDLYWQALENPGIRYRAFVHLTDGAALWGQQDDDPACRLPTSVWRASQRGVGQFRLPIDPDTPLGRYPLIIGLYDAETLERLKITGGSGKAGDDFLWLGDIEVIEAATEKQPADG